MLTVAPDVDVKRFSFSESNTLHLLKVDTEWPLQCITDLVQSPIEVSSTKQFPPSICKALPLMDSILLFEIIRVPSEMERPLPVMLHWSSVNLASSETLMQFLELLTKVVLLQITLPLLWTQSEEENLELRI